MPNRNLDDIIPYEVSSGARMSYIEKREYICLDWNESAMGPSPIVNCALMRMVATGGLNFYPDITATDLRNKLSRYTKVPPEFICCTNGSDEALRLVCTAFLGGGDGVLLREPVYDQIYPFVVSCGARVLSLHPPSLYEKELYTYRTFIETLHPAMVYVVNPNNPTGVIYDVTDIAELLIDYPNVLFLVDEAYYEYTGVTVAPLVEKHHNLIVTRTFSKAFGLAGLRIGYMLAHPVLMDKIDLIRNGKDVNVLAQMAAVAALSDVEYMYSTVRKVKIAKKWTCGRLREMGVHVVDTPANFVLIQTTNYEGLIEYLRERRILVRDRSKKISDTIRVTIGVMGQMEKFVKAMRDWKEEMK